MNKVKECRWIILIIILILGLSFYWYEWRPYQTEKKCNKVAIEASKKGPTLHRDETYELSYKMCLREKGL